MDKKAFFKALSDEAAQPDSKFILELQDKVSAIAGGVPPSSSGLNFPTSGLVAIAAVTLAIIGAVTYGVIKKDPAPVATNQPVTVAVESLSESKDVLADVDESEEQSNDADVRTQEESAVEVSVDDQVPVATPSSPSQPTVNPTTPPGATPLIPNENYTVEFWSVPSVAGALPQIPSAPADFVITDKVDVNFDWGQGSPGGSITKNHFVARATALKFLDPDRYTMNIFADDGVRVYIDDKLVHSRWSMNSLGIQDKVTFSVNSSSVATKIVIEYFELQNSARLIIDLVK